MKTMLNDNQLKRALSFGQYGRYALIRNIINTNRKNNKKFKVLDVGGRGGKMRKFLPDDDVYYLDLDVDNRDSKAIQGDGCDMTFADNSFDWVVSADVFEHIPEHRRERFIQENIRVAKYGVILAAPFYSKAVSQAEIDANKGYKELFDFDHIWLKEHIVNGLPKEKDLELFLERNKLDFQKIHNNTLFLWKLMQNIHFMVLSGFDKEIQREFEELSYFCNDKIFPHDMAELSYRKVYFIKKDKQLKNLAVDKKNADDSLFLELIEKTSSLISKMLSRRNLLEKNRNHLSLNKYITEVSDDYFQELNKKIKTSNNKIVVYTAIFGDKDNIKEPLIMDPDCDFVCFTDNHKISSGFFDVILCNPIFSDPHRNARMFKLLSHKFFPKYKYTVWIDGSVVVKSKNIKELIDTCLKDANFATYKHLDRRCIYEEAMACIELNRDDSEVIQRQIKKYQKEKYPEGNGLISSGVIIRNNLAPDVIKLNEDWWAEIKEYSRRDQISFNYVAWKNRFKYNIIPGNIYENDYFRVEKHKITETANSFAEILDLKNEKIEDLVKELTYLKKYFLIRIILNARRWAKIITEVFMEKDKKVRIGKKIKFGKKIKEIVKNSALNKSRTVLRQEGIKTFLIYAFKYLRYGRKYFNSDSHKSSKI